MPSRGRRPSLWAALLAGLATATPAPSPAAPVIPPGREDLLLRVLGGADTLPGDCRLEGASVDRTFVRGRYACAGAPAVLELHHTSHKPAAATTERFALVAGDAVPEALVRAVAERVRAEEKGFSWAIPDGYDDPAAPASSAAPAAVPARADAPRAAAPAPFGLPRAGPWLLAAALAAGALALALGRRAGRRDWAIAAALAAGALALRIAFGLWGPAHANGQGPLWIYATLHPVGFLGDYGPGFGEVFGWVASLRPYDADRLVFSANATLSALAVAAVFGLARAMGIDRLRALTAAALVAIDPPSVRIAATESYLPAIGGLVSLGALAFALAARSWRDGRRAAAALGALAGALLLAQAVRVQPAAWVPAATAPLAAALVAGLEPARRLRLALAALAIAAVAVTLTSAGIVAAVGPAKAGLAMPQWLGLAAAAAAALLALACRPRWPVLLAIPVVGWMIATRGTYIAAPLTLPAYDRMMLVLALPALAALLPARAPRPWLAPAPGLALAALVLWAGGPRPEPNTEQAEYAWLAGRFPRLAGCDVAWVVHGGSRLLWLPGYLVPQPDGRRPGPVEATHTPTLAARLAAGRCLWYVHASICSSAEGREACAKAEAPLRLEETDRVVLPARPSFRPAPYDAAQVEVTLSRVAAVGAPEALAK